MRRYRDGRGCRGTTDPTFRQALALGEVAEDEDNGKTVGEKRVYFVLDAEAGQVKIGVSRNVAARIREFSRSRGREVELLGTLIGGDALEIAMHSRFRPYRQERAEWFSAEILPEVLTLLDQDREFYGLAA